MTSLLRKKHLTTRPSFLTESREGVAGQGREPRPLVAVCGLRRAGSARRASLRRSALKSRRLKWGER